MELKFCELCNIQLKNQQGIVCFTCFEILIKECFPPEPEESEEEEEEPEKKKRKRT